MSKTKPQATKVTNCREMFAAAALDDRLSRVQRRKCQRIAEAMQGDRRASQAIERLILRAYERDNGPVGVSIDWQKILDWFIENGPALLRLLVALLAIFGI